ncbi:importin 4 [Cavenderia fasciculata]|uniref:Importin 4 n=1 Tax=Cavenderia fasciculata TaxID=261658 RepID=F4PI16_CACFS|nr:importin 4 [Cavenderia fasciculata]EGG24503.1 importin 4 [Cavenderia fasciculata]|eukprot:XP_004362354.1 importin 4 [Cavenderia fasciculata]
MSIQQKDIDDILICLRGMLQPETVTEATQKLNSLLKRPISSLILMNQIQSSQFKEVIHQQISQSSRSSSSSGSIIRQLSAVLMRKKISVHWLHITEEQRVGLKSTLLQQFMQEPENAIKKAVAEVIIIICRISLPIGDWNEFLPFLYQLSQQQNSVFRELQMYMFEILLEHITVVAEHSTELAQLFKNGLNDPVLKVRTNTLKAVGSAIVTFSHDKKVVEKFLELMPLIIENIKICIQNHLDEEVQSSFVMFDELVESQLPTIVRVLPEIIKFSYQVAAAQDLDPSVRISAVEFIDVVIQNKPKIIRDSNLLEDLLKLILGLITTGAIEEDLEENELFIAAGVSLKHIGEEFSAKLVFHPLLGLMKQFSESQDLAHRISLPLIIQQLSYGCAEEMRDQVEAIVHMTMKGLADPNKTARQNAFICIARLSEHIEPEIYRFSNIIFPAIFKSLDDPDNAFVLRCCYALEAFLSNLETEELLPVLPSIMEKVGQLLERDNVQVKEFALSAITAIALSAEEHFAPYFDKVFTFLNGLLSITDQKHITLRANAMDCMGAIAKTVPKERIIPFIPNLMSISLAGLNLGVPELTELTFSFYSIIFEHFGEDMAPYLKDVFQLLLKSALSDDGLTKNQTQSAFNIQGIDNDESESGANEEEEENYSGLSVRTNFLDEKSAAIHCLATLAHCLPKSFFPYVQELITALESLCQYFHEDIRFEALGCLSSIITSVVACYPIEYKKGDFTTAVPEPVKVLLQFSFQIYNHILTFEVKKSVVSKAFLAIADTVKEVGPAAIAPFMNDIGNHVMNVVKGHAYCQTVNRDAEVEDDDEEDQDEPTEDEDEEESDYNLLHYASECMIEIATASGHAFKTYFEHSLQHLLKLTNPKNHHSIVACVIGTLAEILRVIEVDCSPYFERLYTVCMKALKDESPQVRRVSCFMLGILIKCSVCATKEHYVSVLQAILPMLQSATVSNEKEVVDNVMGCVARMIYAGSQNVPLVEVLPMFLAKLPIQKDLQEISSVFDAIFLLYSKHFDIVSPHTARIVSIFAHDLAQKLEDDVREKIVGFIKQLGEKFGPQMEQIISQLPVDQKSTILTQIQK